MSSTEILKANVRRQFDSIGRRYQCMSEAELKSHPREVLKWPAHPASARVLDLACGRGDDLYPLSQGARVVVALDLSGSMLEAARERNAAGNIMFVQGDGLRLPFSSGSFDACYSSFCFAHILRARRMIREMTRILRPRGVLAIMDIVAVGRQHRDQVNRLERAREVCYTRIHEFTKFIRLFCGLPLEWRSCVLTKQAVDFRGWIGASCLDPRSSAFRQARLIFQRASAEQKNGQTGNGPDVYRYIVAQLLLRRMA